MTSQHKYARVERERRFLLERFPSSETVQRTRAIADRYIEGTRLRLREQKDESGPTIYKLTQKIPERAKGAQQGLITNMYLAKEEFDVLAKLPAKTLSKNRYSVAPFGIDAFQGELKGLFLAEAEFDSEEGAAAMMLPPFMVREVSDDDRFTGGALVRMSRKEIQSLLLEFGIKLCEN